MTDNSLWTLHATITRKAQAAGYRVTEEMRQVGVWALLVERNEYETWEERVARVYRAMRWVDPQAADGVLVVDELKEKP